MECIDRTSTWSWRASRNGRGSWPSFSTASIATDLGIGERPGGRFPRCELPARGPRRHDRPKRARPFLKQEMSASFMMREMSNRVRAGSGCSQDRPAFFFGGIGVSGRGDDHARRPSNWHQPPRPGSGPAGLERGGTRPRRVVLSRIEHANPVPRGGFVVVIPVFRLDRGLGSTDTMEPGRVVPSR